MRADMMLIPSFLQLTFDYVINMKGHDAAVEDMCFNAKHRLIASVGGSHPQLWRVMGAGEWYKLAVCASC